MTPIGDVASYHAVPQHRCDTWWRIAESARRLAAAPMDDTAEKLGRQLRGLLASTDAYERYFSYPGQQLLARIHQSAADPGARAELVRDTDQVSRRLLRAEHLPAGAGADVAAVRPRFDVLVLANLSADDEQQLQRALLAARRPQDPFGYELVVVRSAADALVAVLVNPQIQAVIVQSDFLSVSGDTADVDVLAAGTKLSALDAMDTVERVTAIAAALRELRPELDLYLVENAAVEMLAARVSQVFDAVVLGQEDILDLHLSVLGGVSGRYRAPFFAALSEYARKPTGVFHALPISRGNSVAGSQWIGQMADFYGLNIFLAETSSTAGGLDSLLEPHGPLRDAQQLAARAFGSQRTFFVTNGTSTANKIVCQALLTPGDVVLVDRNCHKSHHYAQVLAGSRVAYLDSYALDEFSMYGAIPLRDIKRVLLAYREAGRLDAVRMISLTNCTFDGVVYNVEQVMTECLAIKPDLVFLWDEAWFGFARFHPLFRRRTAMAAAAAMAARFSTAEYRNEYQQRAAELAQAGPEALVDEPLLPDPDEVQIRVYATQSTHKTLTALRQGSMIHVYDQHFRSVTSAFNEAYMTHTSTSPNYQILASLDMGRRQVELEGYELVQRQVELAMTLRDAIAGHRLLQKYFRVLDASDLIPDQYRQSGADQMLHSGPTAMDRAWRTDEFVLDPSRVTIEIGATGIDGDTFRRRQLMDRWGIQVNKTTRNTVLAMTNIGTTRTAVAHLMQALVGIAEEIEDRVRQMDSTERDIFEQRVHRLQHEHPPLPDFSRFHKAFRISSHPDGDMRCAFFLSYDAKMIEYLSAREIRARLKAGNSTVSASFVTPYPPGFPILVPGQEISTAIIDFMEALDTKEIHGFDHERGFQVLNATQLARITPEQQQ